MAAEQPLDTMNNDDIEWKIGMLVDVAPRMWAGYVSVYR